MAPYSNPMRLVYYRPSKVLYNSLHYSIVSIKMRFIWTKSHPDIVRPAPNVSVWHDAALLLKSYALYVSVLQIVISVPYLYLNSHQDGSTLPLCVRHCISSFSTNPVTNAKIKSLRS